MVKCAKCAYNEIKNQISYVVSCQSALPLLQHRLHRHSDFFGDFLVHNFGNADVVIGKWDGELRPHFDGAVFYFDAAFDDAFLFHAMDVEHAFGTNGVGSVLTKICFFDDFS